MKIVENPQFHKNRSFPAKISLVNGNISLDDSGFVHIYQTNFSRKTLRFVKC